MNGEACVSASPQLPEENVGSISASGISVAVLCTAGRNNRVLIRELGKHFNIAAVVFERKLFASGARILLRIKRQGLLKVLDQFLFKLWDIILLHWEASRLACQIFECNADSFRDEIAPLKILKVRSVNSPKVKDLLLKLAPEVIVVSGTSLLSAEMIAAIKPIPLINFHLGITPEYRGQSGGFWAIVNRDFGSVGTTVHFIENGTDSGPIIFQKSIEFGQGDSPSILAIRQFRVGIPLVVEAVRMVVGEAGRRMAITPCEGGRTYSVPGFSAYLTYRRNMRYSGRNR